MPVSNCQLHLQLTELDVEKNMGGWRDNSIIEIA